MSTFFIDLNINKIKMNAIIMVLGSPNDNNGNLSTFAFDRLYRTYDLAESNETSKILCTGGIGEHFNKTNKPHFYYAQEFLKLKGIDPSRFLPGISSKNTVEDFSLSKSLIEEIKPDLLIIITSEFHMERVKILAEAIIPDLTKFYVSVDTSLTTLEMKPLIEHEKNAIIFLKENGIKY